MTQDHPHASAPPHPAPDGRPRPGAEADAREFVGHRGRLFGLAYRMLGSADEAEDVVQDAYLRWSGTDRGAVSHPGAWLAKVVTHLCLNRLTSARATRESYTGSWLPEPVLAEAGAGPLEAVERHDDVSTALLLLLERLTPAERAVYVLREAFGYPHREIAGLLDIGEANCRQLYGRAARRVAEPGDGGAARFGPPEPERRRALVESFVAAARDGDLAGLEKVLAQDVVWWSDGGGKVRAALRPVRGRDHVVRFLAGVARRTEEGTRLTVAEVNGAPGIVLHVGERITGVATVALHADGRIGEVWFVSNPDKLGHATRRFAAYPEADG
ncbi:RNA polymerase sigma-70 factor [Streptomyces sp. NRRL F-5727]|uniref:RNA polymerase sigma-70 factor n=1 Tax=Streptomyces sp. NRRL F-5727 TaxID=1463871 RepID=UPI0007C7079A|nr:RNA polymerase sigma-70 factor [Streptomyces sp. NRRL F-5727]